MTSPDLLMRFISGCFREIVGGGVDPGEGSTRKGSRRINLVSLHRRREVDNLVKLEPLIALHNTALRNLFRVRQWLFHSSILLCNNKLGVVYLTIDYTLDGLILPYYFYLSLSHIYWVSPKVWELRYNFCISRFITKKLYDLSLELFSTFWQIVSPDRGTSRGGSHDSFQCEPIGRVAPHLKGHSFQRRMPQIRLQKGV